MSAKIDFFIPTLKTHDGTRSNKLTHSFLMEAGRWTIEGHWLERNGVVFPVKGRTLIVWNQDNWFTMVTKLAVCGGDDQEISFEYRGRLNEEEYQYTYVLQQSLLGRIEGEGLVGPGSIVQRYWVLGDRQRRSGFETFYRLDDNTYHLCGGIQTSHSLESSLEAILKRQS